MSDSFLLELVGAPPAVAFEGRARSLRQQGDPPARPVVPADDPLLRVLRDPGPAGHSGPGGPVPPQLAVRSPLLGAGPAARESRGQLGPGSGPVRTDLDGHRQLARVVAKLAEGVVHGEKELP